MRSAALRSQLTSLLLVLLCLEGACASELTGYLVTAQELRAQGDPESALAALHQAILTRSSADEQLSAEELRLLNAEVIAAKGYLRASAKMMTQYQGTGPQAGWIPGRYAELLGTSPFVGFSAELSRLIQQTRSGRPPAPLGDAPLANSRVIGDDSASRCTAALKRSPASTPYWTYIIRNFCLRVGGPAPPALPLPGVVSAVVLTGHIEGIDPDRVAALPGALGYWLRGSAWYGETATATASATLEARYSTATSRRSGTFKIPWTEEVPYQDTEMATEHYQEPYTMEEPYFVEEPYSSFEGTYQEDCGTATNKMTCSRDRRVTKYHSVVKYHMVTKYRTESRQVPRPVTRYRHISHVYDLHAEEYRRSFSSTVRLSLILADDPEPIVIEQTNNELQTGLLHNDSFGPANLSPSKPKLWSHQEWFVAQVWDLRQRLDTALQERWKRRFCNEPQFTLEQAARCAFRQREVPKPVREVLDEALGVAAPPTK